MEKARQRRERKEMRDHQKMVQYLCRLFQLVPTMMSYICTSLQLWLLAFRCWKRCSQRPPGGRPGLRRRGQELRRGERGRSAQVSPAYSWFSFTTFLASDSHLLFVCLFFLAFVDIVFADVGDATLMGPRYTYCSECLSVCFSDV